MRTLYTTSASFGRPNAAPSPHDDRSNRASECARRQRLAVPGLVGGPLAFVLAVGLFAYAAVVPLEREAFWGALGSAFLLVSLGLLAWDGHFMDCSDMELPPRSPRGEE